MVVQKCSVDENPITLLLFTWQTHNRFTILQQSIQFIIINKYLTLTSHERKYFKLLWMNIENDNITSS